MSWIYCCLFSFTYLVYAMELNKTNSAFKINLGTLFAIYDRGPDETCDKEKMFKSSLERLEMVMHTIDKINTDPNILPNIELVLHKESDCLMESRAFSAILNNFELEGDTCMNSTNKSSRRIWGIIGTDSSAVSIPMAKLLAILKVPQISCGATSNELSNKQRFPYFFRTLPSDDYVIKAIIDFLKQNNWDYVSFIYDDSKYGITAFDAFLNEINQQKNICLAQQHKIPRNAETAQFKEIVRRLLGENETVMPVVAISKEFNLVNIFNQVKLQNATNKIRWLGSDSWTNLNFRMGYQQTPLNMTAEEIRFVMNGAIIFVQQSGNNEKFRKYFFKKTYQDSKKTNKFLQEYFEKECFSENASLNCSHNRILSNNDGFSGNWEESNSDCVYAFAYALDNARKQLCGNSTVVCDEFKDLSGSDLRDYLRNVSYKNGNNVQFRFDKNQDAPAVYNVLKFHDSSNESYNWTQIGNFINNKTTINKVVSNASFLNKPVISQCMKECGKNEYKVYKKDMCCWKCVPCEKNQYLLKTEQIFKLSEPNPCKQCKETEKAVNYSCVYLTEEYLSLENDYGLAVVVICSVGILLTLLVGVVFIYFWNTPLIRATGRELSTIVLIGILLLFVTPFFFSVKPSSIICALRKLFLGASFTFVFSGLLVKTVRITMIFNMLGKKLVRDYKLFLRPTPQVIISFLLISVEVFIVVLIFILNPPELSVNSSPIADKDRRNYISCKNMTFKNLLVCLAYPFVLLMISAIYAIKIRKVPAGYNEAKRIGFAVYTTLVIWLAQLSTYFAQSEHSHVKRDAIYCFFLTLDALIILTAFFGPKVYIVLLRPKKNNVDSVMAMARGRFEWVANLSLGLSNSIVPSENAVSRKTFLSPSRMNSSINKHREYCINDQTNSSLSTVLNSRKRLTQKTTMGSFLAHVKRSKKPTIKRPLKIVSGNDQNVYSYKTTSFGINIALSLPESQK